MRLFGSLKELVSAVFRKDTFEVTLRPNQSTTYTAARDIQLPAKDGNAVLVSSGDIVNNDINASAAIAYSKLALSNSIVNADVSSTAAIDASKIGGGLVSNTEFSYLDGVTSAIQTQINSKQATITGAATTITSSDLTASKALQSDASGKVSTSTVTSTELGYVSGVTSAIQTQLGNKASSGANSDITSLSGLTTPLSSGQGGTGINNGGTLTYGANNISLTTSGATSLTLPTTGTVTTTSNKLSAFASTSSSELAGVISDETGSGSLVFGTSPTLSSPQVNSSLVVQQIATPSNPLAGFDKIYTKSDGLLYKLDSSGNEVPVGSGSGGGGELNLVINSDGDTALDGNRTNDVGDWIDFGTGTTSSKTTTAAEIPLSPLKSNAIKVLNEGSGTDYTRLRMTLPQSLYNRKLKIAWEQEASTSPAYVSGDFKVELWSNAAADYSGAYTRISLSTDASSVSAVPALTGRYQTSFDTSTAANLELRIVRVAGVINSFISLNNVVVGPGIQPQGAVVSEWASYTPTLTNGTNITATGKYRRVGTNMEFYVQGVWSGAGSGSTVRLAIPSGFNIDTSVLTLNNAASTCGSFRFFDNGVTNKPGTVVVFDSTTVLFQGNSAAAVLGSDGTSGDQFDAWFTVPITQFAGSGTVQLAQNDVEYAFNSSTSTTLGDTTTFGYGPSGAQIQNITASLNRRVRFQSPIQPGDQLVVEVSTDRLKWQPVQSITQINNQEIQPFSFQNTALGGVGVYSVINSTDVDVRFGQYAALNGSTFGATGSAWSGGGAGSAYWRVRKSSAGAAVGFGIVSPGVSSGLVSASGLPGRTNGSAIAAGYVGETQSSSWSAQTIGTTTTLLATINNVTPGVYLVTINSDVTFGSATRVVGTLGGTATRTPANPSSAPEYLRAVSSTTGVASYIYPLLVTGAGTVTWSVAATTASTSADCRGTINLVRIA